MLEKILFYMIFILISGLYIYLFLSKDIFRSIISMFLIFLSTAVIYFLMGIKFLGIFQLIIYTGAIMVLFIVAMNTIINHKNETKTTLIENILIISGALLSILTTLFLFYKLGSMPQNQIRWKADFFELSNVLFEKYFIQIEIISFILFVAVVIVYSIIRSEKNEL